MSPRSMGITLNDVIRYAKKAFKFWKKYQAKQNQQQQQGGQQYNNNNQQQYYGQNQQQQQQSPYPASHQGQQQGGAWAGQQQQQQHKPSAGGYGAHDGPATNQDMANAQNPYYVDLRNQAIREGDLMGKAYSASKQAYSSGNGGRAHELSMEGKQHQANKDRLNLQAAEYIFNANNASQPNGSIDLHGLYVKESVTMTERAIANARSNGLSELRVIVGKGNHSPAHVAKIKPAIEELMQKERLTARLDPHNAGVLIVQLQGQSGKGAREVLGDMDRNPDICVVM